MSSNTICLKSKGYHEEAPANAALYPGHLLELMSTGKVRKHSVASGLAEKLFAKEDGLQGKTITQAYAEDDIVSMVVAAPGDVVQARLAANATAVVIGDLLESAGDGTLRKVAAGLTAYPSTSLLYANTAESAEHENTTDAADFDKSYTIPANTLAAGDVLRIRGHVTVVDNNGTDTLTLLVKVGAVTVATFAALDVADNDIAQFDVEVIVRAIGASGKIVANAWVAYDAPGTDTDNATIVETTLDTTAAAKVAVNADWSAAHADNEASLTMLTVELLRNSGGSAAQTGIAIAQEAVDNSAVSAEAFVKVRIL